MAGGGWLAGALRVLSGASLGLLELSGTLWGSRMALWGSLGALWSFLAEIEILTKLGISQKLTRLQREQAVGVLLRSCNFEF